MQGKEAEFADTQPMFANVNANAIGDQDFANTQPMAYADSAGKPAEPPDGAMQRFSPIDAAAQRAAQAENAKNRIGRYAWGFARHWRGDNGLAGAFWINFMLIAQFVGGFFLGALVSFDPVLSVRGGAALFLTVLSLVILLNAWAVIGCIASARFHMDRGGQRWGVLLFGAWLLSASLGWVSMATRNAGMLADNWALAVGDTALAAATVEASKDGKLLWVRGDLGDGSETRLDAALRANPQAKWVALDSRGGWVEVGRRMAKLVKERNLNTHVNDYCVSSCTLIHLAGAQRTASPGAALGFHAIRSAGGVANHTSAHDRAVGRRVYSGLGLSDAFIQRVNDTPHATVWYPKRSELIAEKILTHPRPSDDFSFLGMLYPNRAAFEKALREDPGFDAMAQSAVGEFDAMTNTAWVMLQQGSTDAQVWQSTSGSLRAAIERARSRRSEADARERYGLLRDMVDELFKDAPTLCADFFLGGPNWQKHQHKFSESISQRDWKLQLSSLRNARTLPYPPLEPAERERALRDFRQFLGLGKSSLLYPPTLRAQTPEVQCMLTRDALTTLATLPNDKATQIYRVFE